MKFFHKYSYRVIPIFKKGQRTMLDNYRPISILPVVSKLMERILHDQMFDYLMNENILSEHQYGFRPSHSTTTTLLDCTNEWYVNMDRGLYNLVVFLDLKKAFDTVNHEILYLFIIYLLLLLTKTRFAATKLNCSVYINVLKIQFIKLQVKTNN